MNQFLQEAIRKLIVFLFIVFVCHPSYAQEDSTSIQPPINTARPSMTEGTATMRKGFFQIETGFVYERLDYNNFYNQEIRYPTTFLRYGLSNKLELRVACQYVQGKDGYRGELSSSDTRFSYSGVDDLTFSAKIKLLDIKKIKTNISTAAFLSVPSGSKIISANTTSPSVFLLIDQGLFGDYSISCNIGWQASHNFDSESFIYTFMVPIPWVSSYLELYGNVDYGFSTMVYSYLGAGTAILLKNNIQIDFSGGYLLQASIDISSFYLSTGVSFRLPK